VYSSCNFFLLLFFDINAAGGYKFVALLLKSLAIQRAVNMLHFKFQNRRRRWEVSSYFRINLRWVFENSRRRWNQIKIMSFVGLDIKGLIFLGSLPKSQLCVPSAWFVISYVKLHYTPHVETLETQGTMDSNRCLSN